MRRSLLSALLVIAIVGCGGDDPADGAGARVGEDGGGGRYPEVVRVEVEQAGEGAYDFNVTISSPYDSPERYADGWRVKTAGGEVLGEMTVGHDHATEQPFTRDQTGVEVPQGCRAWSSRATTSRTATAERRPPSSCLDTSGELLRGKAGYAG